MSPDMTEDRCKMCPLDSDNMLLTMRSPTPMWPSCLSGMDYTDDRYTIHDIRYPGLKHKKVKIKDEMKEESRLVKFKKMIHYFMWKSVSLIMYGHITLLLLAIILAWVLVYIILVWVLKYVN